MDETFCQDLTAKTDLLSFLELAQHPEQSESAVMSVDLQPPRAGCKCKRIQNYSRIVRRKHLWNML